MRVCAPSLFFNGFANFYTDESLEQFFFETNGNIVSFKTGGHEKSIPQT
jgi:predicted acetyltransferase